MRPSRRQVDAHQILGVEPGASRAEIRRAYRRRALEIHPDLAGSASTAEMADLNDARDQLLGQGSPADAGAAEDGASTGRRRQRRPPAAPGGDHAPIWDDYWAAWNDPPRRPKT